MLGQVVYKVKAGVISGRVNKSVKLSTTLPNGINLMNMSTANEQLILHFAIER